MADSQKLSTALEEIFQQTEPLKLFDALLAKLGEVLQCDRCFLLVRHPSTRMYRQFCWRRSPEIPEIRTEGWETEQPWEDEDPMFAAALQTKDSIFVEDIETAPATVLNREFERQNLGHRALVHAHLAQDGVLWGILQPSVFGQPRVWSDVDRFTICQVIEKLTPVAIAYVKSAC